MRRLYRTPCALNKLTMPRKLPDRVMTRVTTQSPRQQAGLQKLPHLFMRALSILNSTLPLRSCCFLGSSIYNSGDEPPQGRKGGSDMVECGCVILHTTGGVSV